MKIKAVVKVMNFHSLLRVDNSRRKAEHFSAMQSELVQMMRIIVNNRNLKLDKLVTDPDPSLPVLRFYIGSDFGFCGNVNSSVSSMMNDVDNVEMVVIGKKLRTAGGGASMHMTQEECVGERFNEIKEYLIRAIREKCWSGIEIAYNRYYNSGLIKPQIERIYPLDLTEDGSTDEAALLADFMIEGDPKELLQGMMISYLQYEIKIALASAYASENLMRQNSTSESLKKIDEIEEENLKVERKEKNAEAFKKTTESYVKQKALAES